MHSNKFIKGKDQAGAKCCKMTWTKNAEGLGVLCINRRIMLFVEQAVFKLKSQMCDKHSDSKFCTSSDSVIEMRVYISIMCKNR